RHMGASTPRPCAESRIGPIVTILAAAAALVAADGIVGDAHEPDDTTVAAITMDFVPPPPGSYALHAIMRAPDGPVLDPDGRRLPLSRFTAGKITLLGFIYTSCADARGCPAGPLAHVLKVFLLDEGAVVREIYTTAYLFSEVIVNDIKTLRLADQPKRRIAR